MSPLRAIARAFWEGLRRRPMPARPADLAVTEALAARMEAAGGAPFGPGLALFHADCGSCNGCELELRLFAATPHAAACGFAPSPRQADALLVTGPVTRNMQDALGRTWDAMADPKFVVAVGDCAVDGGVFKGSYAVAGGAGSTLPVDLVIRGCPPTPDQIAAGIAALAAAAARRDAPG